MRSCGASLMRMKGTADDDGYKEEEACGGSWIQKKKGNPIEEKGGVKSFFFRQRDR
jgi:hypothetical protein